MIRVSAYEAGQEKGFLTLYRACLEHYDILPATADQEARVLELLSSGRHMSCLLAFDNDTPAGFATWALTFPAGSGLALYMKELFVTRSARGLGVGRHLLAGLVDIAKAENCTRMDWQTDQGNAISQAFYNSLDAPAFDKVSYRVLAEEFDSFRSSIL